MGIPGDRVGTPSGYTRGVVYQGVGVPRGGYTNGWVYQGMDIPRQGYTRVGGGGYQRVGVTYFQVFSGGGYAWYQVPSWGRMVYQEAGSVFKGDTPGG